MSKPKIDGATIKRAEDRIGKSRARLLLQQPFYGVLLSMMDFIPDCDGVLPTMATDGVKVYYNPEFTMSITEDEVYGVLLHEINHCIYQHCTSKRRLNRESHAWNIATDHVVNLDIKDIGFSLPPNTLYDRKYIGKTAEEVYDMLQEEEKKNPGMLAGLSTLDTHIEGSDEDAWDDMEDKAMAAYEMSKDAQGKGSIAAGMKRWIDKLKKSKVKWERIFHRYIGQALAKDDYSFSRINKRYLGQDIYLPDLRSYTIGNVIVAIDTSGSINQTILEQFAAEINKIRHLVDSLHVITCDWVVHEVVKINKFENFLNKLKFKGGGGTSHKPVFDRIKKDFDSVDLAIMLTDMFSDQSQIDPPPYPVLWVSTSDVDTAPFGQIVQIPNENNNGW